jgi:hypothetical protein
VLTSATWLGEDRGDPNMPLQSTSTLGLSPLHAGGGGSSLEKTFASPTLRCSMRSSFQSRLVISFSLCRVLTVVKCLFLTINFG